MNNAVSKARSWTLLVRSVSRPNSRMELVTLATTAMLDVVRDVGERWRYDRARYIKYISFFKNILTKTISSQKFDEADADVTFLCKQN